MGQLFTPVIIHCRRITNPILFCIISSIEIFITLRTNYFGYLLVFSLNVCFVVVVVYLLQLRALQISSNDISDMAINFMKSIVEKILNILNSYYDKMGSSLDKVCTIVVLSRDVELYHGTKDLEALEFIHTHAPNNR